MIRTDDDNHLILKERFEHQFLIACDVAGDRQIKFAVQQRLDGPPGRFGDYAHFDARELEAERFEHRRQPVIARIALGADSQNAFSMQSNLADVFLNALEFVQNGPRRTEYSL